MKHVQKYMCFLFAGAVDFEKRGQFEHLLHLIDDCSDVKSILSPVAKQAHSAAATAAHRPGRPVWTQVGASRKANNLCRLGMARNTSQVKGQHVKPASRRVIGHFNVRCLVKAFRRQRKSFQRSRRLYNGLAHITHGRIKVRRGETAVALVAALQKKCWLTLQTSALWHSPEQRHPPACARKPRSRARNP